jgi:hypothetical protein
VTIDNPFWDAVKDCVEPDSTNGHPVVGEYRLDRSVADTVTKTPNRQRLVRQYCWTISDPDTVTFIAGHARNGLVDPIAGTGYWAYLLAQLGVEVVCYDLNPGTVLHHNGWHGEDLYAPVGEKDGAEAVALHPDKTLFLSWPPYETDVGARILAAYTGNRLIYIGEGQGATGDCELRQALEKDWTEVDSHQPVQFWGVQDRVVVYERSPALPQLDG